MIAVHFKCALPEETTPKRALALTIWPCAIALSRYFHDARGALKFAVSTKIIELGCGHTALPSLTLQTIFKLNCTKTDAVCDGMDGDICHLDWSSPQSIKSYEAHTFDVVIGSDVLYDEGDFDDVIATTKYLMKKKQEAVAPPASKVRKLNESDRGMTSAVAYFAVHVRDSCMPTLLDGYFRRWRLAYTVVRKMTGGADMVSCSDNLTLDSDSSNTIWIYEIKNVD